MNPNQELRSWLNLDPSIDAIPDCVSPVVGNFLIAIQEARAEWRAQIPSILSLLIGSKGDDALERRRMFRCADWAVREVLLSVFPDNEDLAGLPPIVDEESAQRAAEVCDEIYKWITTRSNSCTASATEHALYSARSAASSTKDNCSLFPVSYAAETAIAAVSIAPHFITVDPIKFIKELVNSKQ